MPPRTLVKDETRCPLSPSSPRSRRHVRLRHGHASAGRTAYSVMRHLHTPAGERDPICWRRGSGSAALLAHWFRDDRPRPSLSAISAGPGRPRRRSPRRCGLTPIVYDPADTPAWSRGSRRSRAGTDRRPQQHRARHRRAARRRAAGGRWCMRISAHAGWCAIGGRRDAAAADRAVNEESY